LARVPVQGTTNEILTPRTPQKVPIHGMFHDMFVY
jgi:hypothetical protein